MITTLGQQVVALAQKILGNSDKDTLFGSSSADVFDGKGGNDYEQGASWHN